MCVRSNLRDFCSPDMLEYQSALRFLSRELGLTMDRSRDIRKWDIS